MTEKTKTEKKIDALLGEYNHKFFKSNDLKAAAAIGMYFRDISYLQENILGTRTLIKNTRVWFKEFNRLNLLEIFSECNRIAFIISEKERSGVWYSKVRKIVEENLKDEDWNSSPAERSLAFMIGYDIFVQDDRKEQETDEE